MERSVKGSITSLGLKIIGMSKKNKHTSSSITNVGLKEISKIIKEFEKLYYEGYVRKRSKHKPTVYMLARFTYLDKCMIIADTFNSHVDLVRTEMTSTQ